MYIMISHEHREKALAEAWKNLLTSVAGTRVSPWYSSDSRPEGGVGAGEWWTQLHQHIDESEYVLAILTRSSVNRPWIIWECGLASGQPSTQGVIPILFDMTPEDLTGPLSGLQTFPGDTKESVTRLCLYLCDRIGLTDLTEKQVEPAVDHYLEIVETFYKNDPMSRLFGGGFHKKDASLSGRWEATWKDSDGETFEVDTFDVYMYDDQVRIIGQGGKGYSYPMEGKLSAQRFMSLVYWSQAHITVTGVTLLRVSPNGLKMKGQWIGHTTRDFEEEDMQIIHGEVVCRKIQ